MLVKNISARLHHFGAVAVIPGETVEIPDAYKNSIDENEIQVVQVSAKKQKAQSTEVDKDLV